MVKLDRIEHTVTIPEGVSANISEDGVVTITGPKGSLTRTFESDVVELFQDGSGLIVRVDLPDESSALSQERGTPTSTTWSRALPTASPTT